MSGGKKSTAERICYGAFDVIHEKTGNDPLKVFRTAIDNVKPVVEVKSRRVGGASYQVPVEIRPARRMSWHSDGWRSIRALGVGRACERSSRLSCWTRRTIRGRRLRSGKTCIGWRRPIRPSRTIAGSVILCCSWAVLRSAHAGACKVAAFHRPGCGIYIF
jgi:Ribosomal protein S7